MDIINRAFLEILQEGDANGRGFQYPIPTYNITKDFDWDNPNTELLFKITSKYGTPYFQNFINSDLDPDDVRSMCCRLQLDKRELRRRGGGLFGSDEFTGSIGVVTINLPRIAYLSENEKDFFSKLSKMMDIAKRSLEVKREVIEKLNDEGLYPYTKRYLKNFDNHFSTIGLIGMNETTLNARWLNKPLYKEESRSFAIKVLDFMRDKIATYQEETGHLYNLEATPAESTTYRLAKADRERYPGIITAGDETPYYTNSSHLPVDFDGDMFTALGNQEDLQAKYTGGTVFHTFLGEKISDWKVTRNLVEKIATNYRIPYFTISPTYSICPDHGYITGEHYECPHCGKTAEVYSRITGYYRPVQHWNRGKKEEFKHRKEYDVSKGDSDEVRRMAKSESGGLSGENRNDSLYLRL
jgi:ribonucleoside-triphosphate reductase